MEMALASEQEDALHMWRRRAESAEAEVARLRAQNQAEVRFVKTTIRPLRERLQEIVEASLETLRAALAETGGADEPA